MTAVRASRAFPSRLSLSRSEDDEQFETELLSERSLP